MQDVMTYIKNMMHIINSSGQYTGLMVISIFLLVIFLVNKAGCETKDQNHVSRFFILYGVVSFVFTICPYTTYLYCKIFPGVSYFWMILWVVPVSLIIIYAAGIVVEKVEDNTKRFITGVAILLIIALAGTIHLYDQDLGYVENTSRIPADTLEILDYMLDNSKAETEKVDLSNNNDIEAETVNLLNNSDSKTGQIYVLAADDIAVYARNYNARFILPYGRDILDARIIYTIHDYNSNEMQQLHNWMLVPEENLDNIFQNAVEKGYQYIVLPSTITLVPGTWVIKADGTKVPAIGDVYQAFVDEYKEDARTTGESYGYKRVKDIGEYMIFQK